MKTKCKRAHYRQYHHLANLRRLASEQSISRKFVVGVIALSLSAIPVTGAVAGEGYILMQAEFGLSKIPKFRQLNLAYQDQSGLTKTFDLDPYRSSIVAVPLYSSKRGDTGLFNRLHKVEKQKGEGAGAQILNGVKFVLGLGLVGGVVYMYGKCLGESEDGNCGTLAF
jgi:hypothetical protein